MNDEGQGREKLEEIKRAVKRSVDGGRRVRALKALGKREGRARDEHIPEEVKVNDLKPLTRVVMVKGQFSPGILPLGDLAGSSAHSHQEAILLMHYLDAVLPLQFPFYSPSAAAGGRGWILALLRENKPSYFAALSMAAHHRNSILQNDDELDNIGIDARRQELELYRLAIKGLQERIEVLQAKGPREGLKDGIEVLACIVQLILLEVSLLRRFDKLIVSHYARLCLCLDPSVQRRHVELAETSPRSA
jgi:hypothetical protein